MARSGLNERELGLVADLTGSVAIGSEVVWERPHVVRVALADGRSVITKRPRADAETGEVSALAVIAFERERAVLSLLAGVRGSPAPELLGAEGHLLVMEDLPAGRSLAELLLGDDAGAATRGILDFAGALARFHASTVGLEDRFDERGSQPWWAKVTDDGVEGLVALAGRIGSGVDAVALADEGHQVADGLRAEGWWRTLIHGDACPDNTRVEEGPGRRFRIFDFELSSFGSCLLDASYLVAPFPTCWCFGRIPAEVSDDAVAMYRRTLGEVVPQALDDAEWDAALSCALASWIVGRGEVIGRTLDEDRTWGTTTMRVRVRQWLDAFLVVAARADRFPALLELGTSLADHLHDAWPDAVLGDYPALPTGEGPTVATPSFWRPGL